MWKKGYIHLKTLEFPSVRGFLVWFFWYFLLWSILLGKYFHALRNIFQLPLLTRITMYAKPDPYSFYSIMQMILEKLFIMPSGKYVFYEQDIS